MFCKTKIISVDAVTVGEFGAAAVSGSAVPHQDCGIAASYEATADYASDAEYRYDCQQFGPAPAHDDRLMATAHRLDRTEPRQQIPLAGLASCLVSSLPSREGGR